MSYTIETPEGAITVTGPSVTITRNQQTFEPAFVGNVDTEISGNVDDITEMCGRTEKQKNGSGTWKVTIEGIVVESQLSMLHTLAEGERVNVNAAVLGDRGGEYIVSDTTISHTNDLNAFEESGDSRGPSENAFEFQLQLQEPDSDA